MLLIHALVWLIVVVKTLVTLFVTYVVTAIKKCHRKITDFVKKVYFAYFGVAIPMIWREKKSFN